MIYMDNGATTRICEEALQIMNYYSKEAYGNPSASYRFASAARTALGEARYEIARLLNANPEEIHFTSGGSEGNNLAILGCARASKGRKHLIFSEVEHSSVLGCIKELEREGFSVSLAKCDENGLIKPSEVKRLIRPDTLLISVMYANNEVGTINDVKAIGALAHEKGILFHTDAVASAGCCRMNVQDENIDLLTVSAHKFHGPKGTGFIYIRKGTPVAPLIFGGSQEDGLRAGTENVPAVMGMARAFVLCQDSLEERNIKLLKLREAFLEELKSRFSNLKVNGSLEKRLSGNLNFSIPGLSSDRLVMYLDMDGIILSAGAACASRERKPSHVLKAMGLTELQLNSSIRATFSVDNTKKEIAYVVSQIEDKYKRYANGT